MTAKFNTNVLASELINEAERAAFREMIETNDKVPATQQSMNAIAARVRDMILAQVLLGRWAPLAVRATDDLYQLHITAELVRLPVLRLRLHYDFSRTKLQMLIVERE